MRLKAEGGEKNVRNNATVLAIGLSAVFLLCLFLRVVAEFAAAESVASRVKSVLKVHRFEWNHWNAPLSDLSLIQNMSHF